MFRTLITCVAALAFALLANFGTASLPQGSLNFDTAHHADGVGKNVVDGAHHNHEHNEDTDNKIAHTHDHGHEVADHSHQTVLISEALLQHHFSVEKARYEREFDVLNRQHPYSILRPPKYLVLT